MVGFAETQSNQRQRCDCTPRGQPTAVVMPRIVKQILVELDRLTPNQRQGRDRDPDEVRPSEMLRIVRYGKWWSQGESNP